MNVIIKVAEMTEKRFQERYIRKDNKVFDTWKNMAITRELDNYSLIHIVSHLNQLGELIDNQIKQGRYCIKKYYKLKKNVVDAIQESEKEKCTCYPCQCAIYIKEVLKE